MKSSPASRAPQRANSALHPPFLVPPDLLTPQPLPREFYLPTADVVSPLLLGHFLLRAIEIDGAKSLCGGLIVETEAYLTDDPACHAYVRETPRNRAMWGEHGRAYVFRIYGAYHCVNSVCRPPGTAEAVLIRAVHPIFGIETLQKLRPDEAVASQMNGPGKLCRALQIDRTLDTIDLCDAASPLWIGENPAAAEFRERFGPMITTTRIGLTRGVDLPLRFYLDGDAHISKRVPKSRRTKVAP